MHRIQFVIITDKGEKITNDKIFKEDEYEEEVGCVYEFDSIPMIQDYNKAANLIAGYKQFEIEDRIRKFETILLETK